ncbi:MAG: hypothetical protein FWE23_01010 [Chitinivibrionia bacterium]|nr:hypothetical protein [Chitinivibrionia bacterium]
MKKVISLLLAGLVCVAWAHPFATSTAELVGNDEIEIETSIGTGFVDSSRIGIGSHITYGIGERFNIGIGNNWTINNVNEKDRGFEAPEFSLKFGLIPNVLAIETFGTLSTFGEYGASLIYTWELNSGMQMNYNVGFASNPDYYETGNAFAWGYSVVKPIGSMFVGAEIFGHVFDGMSDADLSGDYTFWNFGFGYELGNSSVISLGFGGNFETNDALNMSLGFTFTLGGR